MDSFACHEAEISLIRKRAARIIRDNPGTDLSLARQAPAHVESDHDPPQSEMEARKPSLVNTTPSTELTSELYVNLAIAEEILYGTLPLRMAQQTKETQSVESQAAPQTPKHETVAPGQLSHDGDAESASDTVDRTGWDDEKDDKTSSPKLSKISPFAAISSCANCSKNNRKGDRAQPRCGRCKEKEESIC